MFRIIETARAGSTMAFITTLLGGLGLVATAQRDSRRRERFERMGGMLLVVSLVGLGFDLARATG